MDHTRGTLKTIDQDVLSRIQHLNRNWKAIAHGVYSEVFTECLRKDIGSDPLQLDRVGASGTLPRRPFLALGCLLLHSAMPTLAK